MSSSASLAQFMAQSLVSLCGITSPCTSIGALLEVEGRGVCMLAWSLMQM